MEKIVYLPYSYPTYVPKTYCQNNYLPYPSYVPYTTYPPLIPNNYDKYAFHIPRGNSGILYSDPEFHDYDDGIDLSDGMISGNNFQTITRMIENLPPSNKCRGDADKIIPFLFKIVGPNNLLCETTGRVYKDLILEKSSIYVHFDIDNLNEPLIMLPYNIKNEIDNCSRRLLIFNLRLTGLKRNSDKGHMNILIVDKRNKTFESFEPWGDAQRFYNPHILSTVLKIAMKDILVDYRYIESVNFNGPQKYVNKNANCDKGGLCVVWATMYAHLRILNPDASNQQISEELLNMAKNNPDNVLKYLTLMEQTVSDSELKSIENKDKTAFDKYYTSYENQLYKR